MNFNFDCSSCPSRCDGVSKRVYNFQSDVDYSEEKENLIISEINRFPDFKASKCLLDGYPDIEIKHLPSDRVFYVEIKSQRRTFMSVSRILPESGLIPSETLALNLSDLIRYFEISDTTQAPIFIMWCLENRPCIVSPGETFFFYQDINVLREIYKREGNRRRFRRESGRGDYVNGQHKGVVVNYHFSLNELIGLDLKILLERGMDQ